ncbi:TetR/AcrR family transcriptional regulator [Aeromicrobium sp. UC242_57]|uniref:TetR/AcrR family transcriptional regulator n=1 Tax=Aeromicrobium sp. UC242_57 TaxID=3374624 RepID=UPI0037994088
MAQTRSRSGNGRATLLECAISNFTERGYHGTSMRDIASDAGVTVASIYHHFPSKQEILQEIMVRTMTDTISMTRSALVASDSEPAHQLDAIVRAWTLFHTTRQQEALIGASELRSLDDVGRKLVVTLRDEQEAMFREVIDRGVALGAFATPFPREAARAVINMGYAIASWYRAGGSIQPAQMAERYSELALGTVRGTSL